MNSKEPVFSINESDYKAICTFDIIFRLEKLKEEHSKQTFSVHVPILYQDGLYYALCIELNQVEYGSSIDRAIRRMGELLQDFVDLSFKGESDWGSLWDQPMDSKYMEIFSKLQYQIEYNNNKKQAQLLNEYISGEPQIDSQTYLSHHETFEVKHELVKVIIKSHTEKVDHCVPV